MFETSKDLLYLVIAFCVLWLTFFICWLLYYMISLMKNVHNAVKMIKEKIAAVDGMIKNVKEKVDNSAMYIGLLANGINKIVEIVKDRKTETSTKKKVKKETTE